MLSGNTLNMPWDGTELCVAEINADGSLAERRTIAGGSQESIFHPEWSPEGILHFVSDRSGWWNLYQWRDGRVEALCQIEELNSGDRSGYSECEPMRSQALIGLCAL